MILWQVTFIYAVLHVRGDIVNFLVTHIYKYSTYLCNKARHYALLLAPISPQASIIGMSLVLPPL